METVPFCGKNKGRFFYEDKEVRNRSSCPCLPIARCLCPQETFLKFCRLVCASYYFIPNYFGPVFSCLLSVKCFGPQVAEIQTF